MTKKISADENKEINASIEDPVLQSRRRLLKLGAYVPPAIVGMAIISSMSQSSFAANSNANSNANQGQGNQGQGNQGQGNQGGGSHGGGHQGSCKPSACRPCMSGGKKKSDGEKNRDRVKCAIAQRQRE